MKTLILTLAVMLCAVTASAEEVPQPSGALVNYHFDNTIEDLTNWLTLQTYDPKTNSFSPVEDPKFAKDGGLVLDRYYTIDGLSLRRHSSQTLVVRLRIGKPVDDEGPILRFGSEDNVRKDGMYLFEADGKDIIIEGINSDTDERHRYKMELPKTEKSGYLTFVLTYHGRHCSLYVGDKKCSFSIDEEFAESNQGNLVLCPSKNGAVTDVIFYNKALSERYVQAFTGKEVRHDLEIGEKEGFNILDLLWPVIFITLNYYLASTALKKRREKMAEGVKFRFNGNVIIIFITSVGVIGYLYIMIRGGGVFISMLAGILQIIVSLAAYILISYRPISQEELEAEQKMREAEEARMRAAGVKEPGLKEELMKFISMCLNSAGKLAGKGFERVGEAMANSAQVEETYRNGILVKREKSMDPVSFLTPLIGIFIAGGLLFFIVISLILMATQLVIAAISFLPLYMFISNRRKYNILK